MAADVDPGNREVMNKLEEVKKTQKNKKKVQYQDGIPKGLGTGLYPRKKTKLGAGTKFLSDKDEKLDKDEDTPKEDGKCEANTMLVDKDENQGSQIFNDMEPQESFNFKQDAMNETAGGVVEKMEEDCTSNYNCKDDNLAEAMYQFANPRRPGHFISISKKDYQLMMEGKSIHCFNSKLGLPMSIRVQPSQEGKLKMKDTSQDAEILESTVVDKDVGNEEKARRETMPIEVKKQVMENGAICSTKDLQHNNYDSLWKMGDSCIRFTAHYKHQWRFELRARIKKRVLRWKAEAATRKQKTNNKDFSASSATNFVGVCRYQAGLKRKSDNLHPDTFQHPRKKYLSESCRNVDLCNFQSSVGSCRNFELVSSCASSECCLDYSRIANASHLMALSQV